MINKFILESEELLSEQFKKLDAISLYNQEKVLNAFKKNKIALRHFNSTNGYGYDDEGRDTLNKLFADIFKAESAIVSPHIASGTHAIWLCLSGLLFPNDVCLSITGLPYDTLCDCINGENIGSLKDYNIKFETIPLKNDKIDIESAISFISKTKTKMVYIQRSRGYEWRDALSVEDIGKAVKSLREAKFEGIILVDNCYGEFVEEKEPIEVGVDVAVGSLIKNIGGGLAPTGGYIVGKQTYINLIANRLTAPSIGGEVGSYAYGYKDFYQGVFLAPHVVKEALKGSLLIGAVLTKFGYKTSPDISKMPCDITRAIEFNTESELIKFIQLIQTLSPIDSYVLPLPWEMPGYEHQVIMAAGCFCQGSSIELSADAPIKKPYIAYIQGGLTYEHIKIVVKNLKF